jgi:hypothetical protein
LVVIVILIVGVFFGALAMELINRQKESPVSRAGGRVRVAASDFRRGFVEGYRGGTTEGRRSVGAPRR